MVNSDFAAVREACRGPMAAILVGNDINATIDAAPNNYFAAIY